jgi:hypothetical protein
MNQWEEYIAAVIKHCSEKYDISSWYWIFGNEPSLKQFSMGTEDEFYNLYIHTVNAATKVYPKIKIGAASFASFEWLQRFIERCGKYNVRVDLLSWHHYGMVPEDYYSFIKQVREWTANYPNLKNAELLIDEWNPMLPDNGTSLSADNYAAAQQAASIQYMRMAGIVYHTFFIAHCSGRRNAVIDEKGVKNPTFNVFKMYSMMGQYERALSFPDDDPYVGGFASENENGTISVMLWNAQHTYDQHPAMEKEISLELGAGVTEAAVEIYLIDDTLSNGYNNPEHQELEKFTDFTLANGKLTLKLKTNSVALIQIKQVK